MSKPASPTEKDIPDPKTLKTDRPVVKQQEKIFTGKEERGRSADQTAQVGRSFGSPTPAALTGGVGIGSGAGLEAAPVCPEARSMAGGFRRYLAETTLLLRLIQAAHNTS